MQTVHTIAALRSILRPWRLQNLRIAFVPTMGNLHRGHLRLLEEAIKQADRVVVSIFVNPMQFGPKEDFHRYPKTLEADSAALIKAGAHVLFVPEIQEIYPSGIEQQTQVVVPQLSELLCGMTRPGHFKGVTTVVTKLFNIVQPDLAFFGEKDFQQWVLVCRMVADLCLPIQMVSVAIEREADGLAMSSRNHYLSPAERKLAPLLQQMLLTLREKILKGDHDYDHLCQEGLELLKKSGFKPDYLQICRPADLQTATATDTGVIILAAAYLGNTRLIDNVLVNL